MAAMLKTAPATQLRLQMFRQPRCPDCGGPLAHGEGCETCPVCGYSHCGAGENLELRHQNPFATSPRGGFAGSRFLVLGSRPPMIGV